MQRQTDTCGETRGSCFLRSGLHPPPALPGRTLRRTRSSPRVFACIAATLVALAARPIEGAVCVWIPDSGGWFSGSNWTGGVVPGGGDTAVVSNGGTATIDSAGGCTTVDITSGSVEMVGGAFFIDDLIADGDFDANLSFRLTGPGALTTLSDEVIGASNTGTFQQSDGSNTCLGPITVGRDFGSVGHYNLIQGTVSASELDVGYGGSGTFTQSAGSVTIVSNNLVIGQDGGNGTYCLKGGTLTLGGNASQELRVGVNGGTGRFEWFRTEETTPTLTAPVFRMGPDGTLAMGFAFNMYDLVHGILSHGTLAGLDVATLEICNGYGAAAHTADEITIDSLVVGSAAGSGTYSLSSLGKLITNKNEEIGKGDVGVFTQTGGTNTVGLDLVIGTAAGGNGTYHLSGTASKLDVSNGWVFIGGNAGGGTGRFEWFNNIPAVPAFTTPQIVMGANGTLAMGFDFKVKDLINGVLFNAPQPPANPLVGLAGATLEICNSATATHDDNIAVAVNFLNVGTTAGSGTYSLHSGVLTAGDSENIGDSGAGVFLHHAGANAIANVLCLGNSADAEGSYYLSEDPASILTVGGNEIIGNLGTGTFYHDQGTNAITGSLILGAGASGVGTYESQCTKRVDDRSKPERDCWAMGHGHFQPQLWDVRRSRESHSRSVPWRQRDIQPQGSRGVGGWREYRNRRLGQRHIQPVLRDTHRRRRSLHRGVSRWQWNILFE